MTHKLNISFRFIPWLICALITVIYALLPTKMHFADGLYFAYHLEEFPISHAWHPHHLLWLPLMHVIFDALHSIIPSLRAMTFFQLSNAILGGLTVYLMIKFVSLISGNRIAGIIIGLMFGFSWGMLHYSADANIYIIILLLMLVAAILITSGNELSRKNAIIATILMIIITSLHQIGFFFSFAILTAIILRSPAKDKIKTAVFCASLYAIVTITMYYAVFLMIRPLLFAELQQSFIAWMTSYGSHKSFWSISDMGFFPAQEIFEYTQFGAFFHNQDILKVRASLNFKGTYNTNVINIFFHVVILFSALILLFQVILKKHIPNRSIKTILLIWFFSYFIFNQLYCAFEIHFKLFFIIPLLAIWTLLILESSPRELKIWNYIAVSFIIAMAVWNFATGVIPESKPEFNPFIKQVMKIEPYLKKGDLIIFARHERYKAAVARYYTDADAAYFQTEFRYISTDNDSFSNMHKETIEFFTKRYDRITLSDDAWNSGYMKWYFSGHVFPPPHPAFLAVQKSRLIGSDFIKNGKIAVIRESDLPD